MTIKNNAATTQKNENVTCADDDHPRSQGRGKAKGRGDQIDAALAMAQEHSFLFRSPTGMPYAAVDMGRGVEALPLKRPSFAQWLSRQVKKKCGFRLPKPAQDEVIRAMHDDAGDPEIPKYPVHLRVGPGEGGSIHLDLCDDQRNVVVVDHQGYHLEGEQDGTCLFERTQGMLSLPIPLTGGGDLDALRKYLNLPNEDAWRLVLCYILFSLRPKGPYVVMMVKGAPGSSKTTFCRILRSLIDPAAPPLQGFPRNERDLIITASHCHLLVLDNVRKVTPDMSDTLCRISTLGGLRVRELFTDDGERLFDVIRPVVLNGLDDYADQPDLLDRSIEIELTTITEAKRQTEAQFWANYGRDHPMIFAGLLEALSATMKCQGSVSVSSPVRMADFYVFGCAVELALGWPQGSFRKAYLGNQRALSAASIQGNPLAEAILELVKNKIAFGQEVRCTPKALLEELAKFVPDPVIVTNQTLWPQSPHALGKRLRKLEPVLRANGINLVFGHSGERMIKVQRPA